MLTRRLTRGSVPNLGQASAYGALVLKPTVLPRGTILPAGGSLSQVLVQRVGSDKAAAAQVGGPPAVPSG